MSKQSIVVIGSANGLITVETHDEDENVKVHIREIKDGAITSESEINISADSLYTLVQPALQEVNVRRGAEMEDK